jgi:hypothetical protein
MAENNLAIRPSTCSAPELNKLVTAYCFGRAAERERAAFEAHLLECNCCWREVQRLKSAIQVLHSERDLLRSISASDLATAFGISAKLPSPLAGHHWHVVASGAIYALLYAVAFLGEIAYEFDRYGSAALKLAPLICCWIFGTSVVGLAVDWKWTLQGSRKGLVLSAAIFLLAAMTLFAAACWFLPASPITQLRLPAYTAQAAYLKDIGYFLTLAALFWLTPFHFVVAMQKELQAGRHRLALGLLAGDKLSVAPRGAIFLKPWVLSLLLAVIVIIALLLHFNLFSNLRPTPYMNLFAHLIQTRLILCSALGIECLAWYYRALNELKRECLAVEKILFAGV